MDIEAGWGRCLGWHLGTLGMRTNPESQPIRAPRRVVFSAKQRQGGQTELIFALASFSDNYC